MDWWSQQGHPALLETVESNSVNDNEKYSHTIPWDDASL